MPLNNYIPTTMTLHMATPLLMDINTTYSYCNIQFYYHTLPLPGIQLGEEGGSREKRALGILILPPSSKIRSSHPRKSPCVNSLLLQSILQQNYYRRCSRIFGTTTTSGGATLTE